MSEVLLANLFFIITGAAVLVVAAFLCILCWQTLKLIKLARRTVERVESGAETIAEDARMLRKYMLSGHIAGRTIRAVTRIARALGGTHTTRPPRRSARRAGISPDTEEDRDGL